MTYCSQKNNSGNIKSLSLLPPLSFHDKSHLSLLGIHLFQFIGDIPPHLLEEWCGENGEAEICEKKLCALGVQYVELIGEAERDKGKYLPLIKHQSCPLWHWKPFPELHAQTCGNGRLDIHNYGHNARDEKGLGLHKV